MIKGGGFPAVRRALLERGWIEKYEPNKVFVTDDYNVLCSNDEGFDLGLIQDGNKT